VLPKVKNAVVDDQNFSFEMVEKPRRGLNWLVKNLGYLCKLKTTFN